MKFELLWLPFGFLAFLFIILNIIKLIRKKRKHWAIFCILSLTFGCLTLLSELHQSLNAVVNDDVSYILDVIPAVIPFITPPTILGLVSNLIISFINTILDNINK